MAIGGTYNVGTVTISSGTPTIVNGSGTLWTPVIEVGDWLFIAGQTGIIATVASNTQLTLETPWITPFPTGAAYVILKNSWLRYDPAITQAKLREFLAQLDGMTPASATVNALARFAAADGKSFKSSAATLTDAGVLTLGGGSYVAGALQSSAAGLISSFPSNIPVARSSNTILAAADKGRYIIATAAFSQTFDTAANLGVGWWVRFRAATTLPAFVTLTAPGGSTINGLASIRVYSGEDCVITCDGANLFVAGLQARVLLDQKTASGSSSLSFTELGANAPRFRSFEFELDGFLPAADNQSCLVRTSSDNGGSFSTTGYAHIRHAGTVGSGTASASGSNSDTSIIIAAGVGSSAGFFVQGFLRLVPVSNGPHITWKIGFVASSPTNYAVVDGYGRVSTNTNAIQFFYTGGNIASGTIRCYGAA